MRTILDKLYHGCGVAAAICVFTIAFSVVTEVIVRSFGASLPGVIEVATFALVGASFLSLADTFRHNIHIRITVLTQHLPQRMQRRAELGSLAVAALITVWLGCWAVDLAMEAYRYDDKSNGLLAIPLWIPQGMMALGIVLMAVSLIEEFVNVLRGRETSYQQRAHVVPEDEDDDNPRGMTNLGADR